MTCPNSITSCNSLPASSSAIVFWQFPESYLSKSGHPHHPHHPHHHQLISEFHLASPTAGISNLIPNGLIPSLLSALGHVSINQPINQPTNPSTNQPVINDESGSTPPQVHLKIGQEYSLTIGRHASMILSISDLITFLSIEIHIRDLSTANEMI